MDYLISKDKYYKRSPMSLKEKNTVVIYKLENTRDMFIYILLYSFSYIIVYVDFVHVSLTYFVRERYFNAPHKPLLP